MGKDTNIEFIDMPESLRNQYQYYTKANMEKFHSVFPDFRFHSVESGVADYVKNYLMKKDQRLNTRKNNAN